MSSPKPMPFDRPFYPINNRSRWYSRGYLPRCDSNENLQSLTFRLYDAVPKEKVQHWRTELEITPNTRANDTRSIELRRRLSKYEDIGCGACWLKDPTAAAMVQDALLHFDNERYKLIAWCVMPNHVHVLFEALTHSLGEIAHSWKSYTAHELNKLLNRTGEVWEREGYDRFIRNEAHLHNVKHYIEQNPVNARLVTVAEDWSFSSAARRLEER